MCVCVLPAGPTELPSTLVGSTVRGSIGSAVSVVDDGASVADGAASDNVIVGWSSSAVSRHGSSSYHLLSSLASVNPISGGERGWVGTGAIDDNDFRFVALMLCSIAIDPECGL